MLKKIFLLFIVYISLSIVNADIYIPTCENCPDKKNPSIPMIVDDFTKVDIGPGLMSKERISPFIFFLVFNIVIISVLIHIRKKQIKNDK